MRLKPSRSNEVTITTLHPHHPIVRTPYSITFLTWLFLLAVTCFPSRGAYGDTSATWNAQAEVIAELNSVNNQLVTAYINEDVKTLQSMLDDDHVHNNVFGVPMTKRQFLRDIESGTLVFETYETDTIRWHVNGDTAVATGIIRAQAKRNGRSVPAQRFLFTRIFTKRADNWKVLLFHNTMMK